jgi:tRNA threonylcarbamoyladenosine biosynthesis protein TsaB
LGIESAGEHLSLALWRLPEASDPDPASWRLLETITSHRGHRHADTLLGFLDAALGRQELQRSDLGLIGVSRGPGGFTGVRVGMATARGLSLGLGIALWPVCSLRGLAAYGQSSGRLLLPLIDARKGEVYGALYRFDALGACEELMAPIVAPVEVLMERAQALDQPFLTFGSGALVSGVASALPPQWHVMSGAHIGALAATAWEMAGRDAAGAPGFDPAYVRASDAELALQNKPKNA